MINSREELIEKAKQFESQEEQINFIINYFLENIQYNYAYLFAKGYAEGDISKISTIYGLAANKTMTEGDSEFSMTQAPKEGESQIYNDILAIRDNNSDNYDKFIGELRAYITKEMESHINNEMLVSKCVDTVVGQIELGLRKKTTVKYNDMDIECNNDISKVLIDFILKPKEYFPPEYNNGLITNGVCEDYTNYLVELFGELGIEAHDIGGTSELGHAWVIVKVGNELKSIDLTRGVFIRDGFSNIPKDQTSQDWLYTDLDKMFAMQKTRSINEIDGKKLETVINGKNFNMEEFSKLLKGPDKTESSIKSIVKNALENGVTLSDVQDAEDKQHLSEKTDKKLDRNDE